MKHPEQSAVAILLPELDTYVGAYRQKYDPSAHFGFPPHMTILWPFMRPDQITEETETQLSRLFSSFRKFHIQFSKTGKSPTGKYLIPNPSDPIIKMISAAKKLFPDYPLYRDKDYQPNPHITIIHEKDPEKLDLVSAKLDREIEKSFPIQTRVKNVWLLEFCGNIWEKRKPFVLS